MLRCSFAYPPLSTPQLPLDGKPDERPLPSPLIDSINPDAAVEQVRQAIIKAKLIVPAGRLTP